MPQEDAENVSFKELYLAQSIRNDELLNDIRMLYDENEYLRSLFKLPFNEISEKNPDFQANYEKHVLRLGEWMVSQKAYKELAIQFGEALGKGLEEIKILAAEKEISVLNNDNVKSHHTNIQEQQSVANLAYKLFKRIKKR